MKKLLKILTFILTMIIFASCATCVKYPDKPYNKKTGQWIEPAECWDWKLCEYYRTKRKGKGDSCKAEYEACYKARVYNKCKSDDIRYKNHSFDNCWHVLK